MKSIQGHELRGARPHRQTARTRRVLHAAALLACASALRLGTLRAETNPVEPAIIPTVHATIVPSSALDLGLDIRGDQSAVWKHDNEQRIRVVGNVAITLGYRQLHAHEAVVYLTPTAEAGESAYDVAIYLTGDVSVQEGTSRRSSTSSAKELLVSSRIGPQIALSGSNPISRTQDNQPAVARGQELREELLNRPAPAAFAATVEVTDTESALQRGWIARGAGNQIVSGPGDVAAPKIGTPVQPGPPTAPPPPPRQQPDIFASADVVEGKVVNGEHVRVLRGSFYLNAVSPDGRAPIELRAQKAVLFAAGTTTQAASTQPAQESPFGQLKNVTAAYLEGDVTLAYGAQTVHADKLYYDFTTNRAVMLDATLNTVDEKRNVPLYMRAKVIRQKARGDFAAKSANFSTSEFATPHYSIGASDVYLRDITPRDAGGHPTGPVVHQFAAANDTLRVQGVPIFYWPYLAGDTSQTDIPLRRISGGYSSTYGLSLQTDWSLFGLAGQKDPAGTHTDLALDYFGRRGPAGGVDSTYDLANVNGYVRSYIMEDNGTDRLGRDRQNIPITKNTRGRFLTRDKLALSDDWTLQVEGSYISDPNFLEQYFPLEFDVDKEPETSLYLKRQHDTEAISILGKWQLFDFVANADRYDDQFVTEKSPEFKYWRVGDSLFDSLTYYSESGIANVSDRFSHATPAELGLQSTFPRVPPNTRFVDYYKAIGWTEDHVVRGDTRQEVDLPLHFGDINVTPYVTGRLTSYDEEFPSSDRGDGTNRVWGAAGLRASTQFWRTYDDVDSDFFDVHRVRHVIEPQINVFASGSNLTRGALQPFDRDVEGTTRASGAEIALHQKWQTKRGPEGKRRTVDWITLDVEADLFWNMSDNGIFFPGDPLRGFYDVSRPELSQVQDSINAQGTWRVGEQVRVMGEESYDLNRSRLETAAAGVAVDHSPSLSYFLGNRYIQALSTDEWTLGINYQLSRKYTVNFAESYDFMLKQEVLSQLTLYRKLPRMNTSLTLSYDANNRDTVVMFSLSPEGFPEFGLNNVKLGNTGGSGR